MKEVWKDVPGFKGYQISSRGRVRSYWCKGKAGTFLRKEFKILKPFLRGSKIKKYLTVCLSKNGEEKRLSIHRLLYTVFIGKIKTGFIIDHIDRNSLNNNLRNLRLVNIRQNAHNRDKYKHRKFKGVYYRININAKNPWASSINVKNKTYHLGYFNTPEKAAVIYNKAAKRFYGNFAVLNKI